MARVIFNGEPGAVFTNDTGKVLFQFVCQFANSCGVCISYARAIGPSWPIPLHRGCRCQQRVVLPGKDALPFVDFMAEIRALPPAQQAVAVGRPNWQLVNKGVVDFFDVVTPQRVRTFEEVVSRNRLDVGTLLKAGVNRRTAEQAYQAVHTPAHELAAAHRKTLLGSLAAKGLTKDQLRTAFGQRVAGRVGIAAGPGGAAGMPVKPTTPKPPGASGSGRADVTAEVLGKLGVKPAAGARAAKPPAAAAPAPWKPRPDKEFKKFTRRTDMDDWGRGAYESWYQSLTHEEQKAVYEYTSTEYIDANRHLRRGESVPARTRKVIEDLKAALDKTAGVPRGVVVYRGVERLSDLKLGPAELKAGVEVTDAGFGSTTLDEKLARTWGPSGGAGGRAAVFQIHVPKGAKGAYVDPWSGNKGEMEFILPPGSTIKIVAVKKTAGGGTEIKAELIP